MRIVVDIETDGLLPDVTKIHCIVTKDIDSGFVREFDNFENSWACKHNAFEWLSGASLIIGHNFVGYDAKVLKKLWNLDIPYSKISDTLCRSRVRYPDLLKPAGITTKAGVHSLECWGHRLGMAKVQNEDWSELTDNILDRCRQDVEITHKLWEVQNDGWNWDNCDKVEVAFLNFMEEQERYGWAFDEAGLPVLIKDLKATLDRLEEEFSRMSDKVVRKQGELKAPLKKLGGLTQATEKWYNELDVQAFNPSDISGPFTRVQFSNINLRSAPQRSKYLHDHGWIPTEFHLETMKPKMTRESVKNIPGGPILSDFVQAAHRMGLLAGEKGFINTVRNGIIHAGGNSCGTPTGRVRQYTVVNIPRVGSFYGEEIRSLFTARPGHKLVGCDLKNIESRLMGHFTHAFDGGDFARRLEEEDLHESTVSLLASVGITAERSVAKSINYAIMYGAGAAKISLMAKSSEDKTRAFIDEWWADKPALDNVRKQLEKALASRGQLTYKYGRGILADKAFIVGLDGRKIFVRSSHSLLNALIQSTGALIHKMSCCRIYTKVQELHIAANPVGNFHDEIQCEVLEKDVDKYSELVVQCINGVGESLNLNVKVDTDVKIGGSWRDTH